MLPDSTWTTGRPSSAPAGGLHEAVAAVARRSPDAAALLFEGRRISYAELDRTADAWAASLTRAGVGRGDLVPIRLPRGPELVIALLAVLKAGAAYALLDVAWPDRRVRAVIDALDAKLLIADEDGDAGVDAGVETWTPCWRIADLHRDFVPVAVEGTDPCCVFFTSGTTGEPKGVLTTHQATARLFGAGSFADFGPETVMPLAAPVPWDAFSLELWSVLLSGGTSLIVAEPYLSAEALREGVADHGVDSVWLTSSLFNMIVDEDADAFAGVRQVMIGGERLSPGHVARFLQTHPTTALINGYGPVESVVFATTHRITEADTARSDGIPIGRPVPGTAIHVLDGDRPCAIGATGEICISGDGLASRYLGDPALTAEKFTEIRQDGRSVRVYRTGDLGVWGANGLLRYLGRADRQVKIRGHRVEPAEVERQIEQLTTVRRCRVVARRDANGTATDLVAFCVPAEPGASLEAELDTLRSTMVAYQCPAALVPVRDFPLTPQGKLDERALLAVLPAEDEPADETVHVHDDPAVRLVADTFAEVLDRPSVPADVSFFELGGTSLAAGRVCARLTTRTHRTVPLARLYHQPDAIGLAAWLDTAVTEPEAEPEYGDEVPLTPMQLVYLTRHLVDPADRTAHCLLVWSLDGEADRDALGAAVEEVHWRHEALSAAYLADPRPVAWLDDVPAPAIEELAPQSTTDAALRVLRASLADELDPGKGKVWRTVMVGAGESTLFGCAVHHIAFDGFSESVLARDLAAAYDGTIDRLPAPPTLAEVHRRASLRHHDVGAHRDRVVEQFAGVPDLCWPAGKLATEPGGPERLEVVLAPEVVAGIDGAAAAAGRTRFVVLLAQWAATLADVTGQRDFAVGVPVAQRDDPLLEQAIGCHITTVPLRLSGAATDGCPDATGALVARAFAAQDVPLGDVLARLGRPRSARPPLFQAMFAVQDTPPPALELPGLHTEFLRQPYVDLPLELHTELWPAGDGGLRVEVAHRPDAVPAATAHELLRRFVDRLHALPTGDPS